jgi:curved DNA-binding protein CbpA
MRLNEKRGIGEVIESAYLQLAAPTQARDPYELLDLRPDASLEVAEAVYKAKVRNIHPDKGGSTEQMKVLNKAIEAIRKKLL